MSGNGSRKRTHDWGTKGPLLPTPRSCSGLRSSGCNQTELLMSLERMQSTFLPADSPASRSVPPESERDETMNDISFRKCFEWWQSRGRVGSSLKTFAACLVSNLDGYSPRLSHRWKGKVSRSSRFVFLLVPSVPRTGEIDCGLWDVEDFQAFRRFDRVQESVFLPTPTTGRADQEMSPSQYKRNTLNLCQTLQMLPTPTTENDQGLASDSNRHTPGLASTVAMLPTPAHRDYRGRHASESDSFNQRMEHPRGVNLVEHLQRVEGLIKTPSAFDATVRSPKSTPTSGDSGSLAQEMESGYRDGESTGLKLQPAFVEWMMGYPIGYTDLKPSETA